MGSAGRWRVGLAVLVMPALLLAAFAARSYRPFGGGQAGERPASAAFVDAVFTVAAVALVALVIALVWVRWQAPRRRTGIAPSRFSLGAFLLYLVLITLAVVVFRYGLQQELPVPEGEEDLDPAFPTITVPEQRSQPGAVDARAPQLVWPLAAGVAAVLTAAVVAALVVRRRRGEGPGEPTREQVELVRAALDEAIEDLRADPDPRRAVVAAYARMEQALSVLGLPRNPAEAPYEYLVRVGRELEAGSSLAALTELFELAKFSDHHVGEPMRQEAIEALAAVRDEVRRAP